MTCPHCNLWLEAAHAYPDCLVFDCPSCGRRLRAVVDLDGGVRLVEQEPEDAPCRGEEAA